MGIFFGEKLFGFRCSLVSDEITEIVFEIQFENLDNEIIKQIIQKLSTFDNPKHVFHIYDSFTDTYGDIGEIGYMWRIIEKTYLNKYLDGLIIENDKMKLLNEQRERCGIRPYKK